MATLAPGGGSTTSTLTATAVPAAQILTLHAEPRRVAWRDDAVDNEGMNKRKSKCSFNSCLMGPADDAAVCTATTGWKPVKPSNLVVPKYPSPRRLLHLHETQGI